MAVLCLCARPVAEGLWRSCIRAARNLNTSVRTPMSLLSTDTGPRPAIRPPARDRYAPGRSRPPGRETRGTTEFAGRQDLRSGPLPRLWAPAADDTSALSKSHRDLCIQSSVLIDLLGIQAQAGRNACG